MPVKKFCLLLLMLCLLYGCQKSGDAEKHGKKKPAVPAVFTAKVTVTQYEKTYAALAECRRGEGTSLRYIAPEETAGLYVSLTPSGVQLDCLGLHWQNPENVLPPGHFLSLLNDVLAALQSPGCFTVRESGDKFIYDGQAGGIPFTLEQNRGNGALTRLSVGAYDCEAAFSDFAAQNGLRPPTLRVII